MIKNNKIAPSPREAWPENEFVTPREPGDMTPRSARALFSTPRAAIV